MLDPAAPAGLTVDHREPMIRLSSLLDADSLRLLHEPDRSGHIVTAIDAAVVEGCPVIGLLHSGGAALADGVEALDGAGRVFAAMIRASGRAVRLGLVDEVIDPAQTRRKLVEAFAAAPPGRGRHGNIPL